MKTITIPIAMFQDLCHDANWKISLWASEGNNRIDRVRVFNKKWGDDYSLQEKGQ